MSVPPPSWTPNSTSTGSSSSSVRSTTAVSNTTSRVATARMRGQHRAEDRRSRRRTSAIEPDWSTQRMTSLQLDAPAAPVADEPLGDDRLRARAGSAAGWRGWCGASRCRRGAGGWSALLRLSAAADRLDGPAVASRSISSSTTLRTTARAVSLVLLGHDARRARAGRRRDGRRARPRSSISGSSSICFRPSRSKASFCITWTTGWGKSSRMSPSQRATARRRGTETAAPSAGAALAASSASGRVVEAGKRTVEPPVAVAQAALLVAT